MYIVQFLQTGAQSPLQSKEPKHSENKLLQVRAHMCHSADVCKVELWQQQNKQVCVRSNFGNSRTNRCVRGKILVSAKQTVSHATSAQNYQLQKTISRLNKAVLLQLVLLEKTASFGE